MAKIRVKYYALFKTLLVAFVLGLVAMAIIIYLVS